VLVVIQTKRVGQVKLVRTTGGGDENALNRESKRWCATWDYAIAQAGDLGKNTYFGKESREQGLELLKKGRGYSVI